MHDTIRLSPDHFSPQTLHVPYKMVCLVAFALVGTLVNDLSDIFGGIQTMNSKLSVPCTDEKCWHTLCAAIAQIEIGRRVAANVHVSGFCPKHRALIARNAPRDKFEQSQAISCSVARTAHSNHSILCSMAWRAHAARPKQAKQQSLECFSNIPTGILGRLPHLTSTNVHKHRAK